MNRHGMARRDQREGLNLKLLPKIFKHYLAEQSGNDGNCGIRDGENIFDAEHQALSVANRTSKFPHQKIGIEQKDYETDLNNCPPDRCQLSALSRIRGH